MSIWYPLICIPILYVFIYNLQIHINLMIMEARMQSELLFALRALMNYML